MVLDGGEFYVLYFYAGLCQAPVDIAVFTNTGRQVFFIETVDSIKVLLITGKITPK